MPGGEAAEEYHSKDFEWDQLRQEIETDPSLRYHLLPLHVNADGDDANSNGPSSSSQSLSGSSSSPSHDSEAWNNFHARHSSGKFFKVSFLADFSSPLLPSLLVGLAEDPKNVQVGAKDELSRVKTLDYPPLDICPTKLDGSNYLLWSRSFTLAITTHGMSKFIEGPVPQPTVAGSELEAWTSQNALAMTWLFNSMKLAVLHTFLFLDTPYKVWVAVAQIYSQKGNDAQALKLRKKLRGLDQHNRSLAEYYAELCGVWQELDYYHGFQAVCSADAATFQQRVEKERIYDFLAGLDMKYDLIRVQVLGRIPFPSLGEAYACVQQEESRQSAMVHLPTLDHSVLAAIPTPWDRKPIQGQLGDKAGSIDRDLLWCDYCHKTKHTREFCWKLHGRPSRGRGGGPVCSHAHVSESTIDTLTTLSGVRLQAPKPDTSHAGTLSQGELQTLRRLMARLDTPSSTASTPTTSSYFAHTGTGYGENDWQC